MKVNNNTNYKLIESSLFYLFGVLSLALCVNGAPLAYETRRLGESYKYSTLSPTVKAFQYEVRNLVCDYNRVFR